MGKQITFNPLSGQFDMVSVEDLSGYVPYTGATTDVNLGTHNLDGKEIRLTETALNNSVKLKSRGIVGSEQLVVSGYTGNPTVTGLIVTNSGDTDGQINLNLWTRSRDVYADVYTGTNTLSSDGTYTIATGKTGAYTAGNLVLSPGGTTALTLTPTTATFASGTGVTLSGMTAGSVLFTGTSGLVSQDNANLFFDDTNNRFVVGASATAQRFGIGYGHLEFKRIAEARSPNLAVGTPAQYGDGAVTAGIHYYRVTYTTEFGETAMLGNVSAAVTVTAPNNAVDLTNIPVSTSAKVTGRKIYRSRAGAASSTCYHIGTISNNTATTFTDKLADGAELSLLSNQYYRDNTTSSILYTNDDYTGSARMLFCGSRNTSLGVGALGVATSGIENTALGTYAQYSLTTAIDVVAVGFSAAFTLRTGSNCTAVGTSCLYSNDSGLSNTALGSSALFSLSADHGNVAVGVQSGYSITGGYNTCLGYRAGYNITTGTNNVFIGTDCGYTVSKTISYAGGIGSSVIPTKSNTFVIGYLSGITGEMNLALGNEHALAKLDVNGNVLVADRAVVGSEMQNNGNFTGNANNWTLGAAWAYNSNNVIKNADGTNTLSQTTANMVTAPVAGHYYVVMFTISSMTAGSVSVTLGGTSNSITYDMNGTYMECFIATNTDGIVFTPSNAARFIIDTVTIKEFTGGSLTALTSVKTPTIASNFIASNDLTITCGTDKTLVLSETVYNDINIPMTSGKVPASNYPAFATFTANTKCYTFAIDDYMDLPSAEVLHDWKETTALDAHLHIITNGLEASATKAQYIIYYSMGDMNEAMSVEASLTAELTIPANTPDKTHLYLDMGDITMTNYKIGTAIICRVKRIDNSDHVNAHASFAEPAANPFVAQVGFHYQIDTLGSRTESGK